ncbi:hypothetical protein [Cellulomonas sp. H30R-01]|uniref:hypothetical protein n=1 Tax=Cellulomonas sp. H30R-01 TaxID=2704467 RepID=UPI00139081FA|nr:hypothetical protein [Cellulomonas sp. H30R-01]
MSDSPENLAWTEAVDGPGRTSTSAVRADAGAASGRSPRAPRRAVRRAGTVGTDESVLRSTHPAAPADGQDDAASPATPAQPADASHDPAVPLRALDDTDVGWGHDADSNDDRLHRDRPPHW